MQKHIILLLLLLTSFGVNAQDDKPEYRLRTASVEEYASFVMDAKLRCENYSYDKDPHFSRLLPCIMVIDEIETNYAFDDLSQLNFEPLSSIYELMGIGGGYNTPGNDAAWNQAMILAWLRENRPDLEAVSELEFGDFKIDVTPRDYDGDGDNEYWFDVHSENYSTYNVIDWNQAAGQYEIIPTSLPILSSGYSYWMPQSGSLEDLLFKDVNDDGLPEWIVAFGGYGYRGLSYGDLYILAWRDGKIVSIANQDIRYTMPEGGGMPAISDDVGWEFTNLDEDMVDEIQLTDLDNDVWGCHYKEIQRFDWDEAQRIYISPGISYQYDNTLGCAQRSAEETMWAGDYDGAAWLYRYALSLPQDPEHRYSPEWRIEQRQYIRARLALAYQMTQQRDNAKSLVDELSQEKPASALMEAFIAALVENETQEPERLCAELYNLFEKVSAISVNYNVFNDYLPSNLSLGVGHDYYGVFIGDGTVPDPAKAGCNAPLLIEQQLDQHPIYRSAPVIEQLYDMNFVSGTSIQADMDNDGIDEWLVWNDALVNPLFLSASSEANAYSVTRPAIRPPDSVTIVGVYNLPNNAGKAIYRLVNLENAFYEMATAPYDFAYGHCISETGDIFIPVGIFDLWQMQNGKLERTLHTPLCEHRTFAELLPEGEMLNLPGWVETSTNASGEPIVGLAMYIWDDKQQKYIPSILAEGDHGSAATLTPIAPTPTLSPVSEWEQVTAENTEYVDKLFYSLYQLDDTEAKLQQIDQALADILQTNNSSANLSLYTAMLHYLRANTLENISQPQEAVDEYLSTYRASSDSIWGILAMLHLECVNC